MQNKGLHQYRFNRGVENPLEKKFAELWEEHNIRSHTLEYLLSLENRRGCITERDSTVAATVIQWLGTPVGRGFLCDVLGLEKI